MKKLIPFSLICILAAFTFSSCNSSYTLTKRHYTKGYYVAHNNGKVKQVNHSRGETNAAPKSSSLATAAVKNLSSEVQLTEQITATAPTKKQNPNEKINSQLPLSTSKHKTVVTNPALSIKPNWLPLPVLQKSDKSIKSSSSDEGRSLLWILIIVLLVLWALGIISGAFGLGILINVLLVVAVILLILWLLRLV